MIALALNIPMKTVNEPFNYEKYPGSEWINHFLAMCAATDKKCEIARNIPDGTECLLIQEESNNTHSHLKTTPMVNFCLESKIYTDWYSKDKSHFKHIVSFEQYTKYANFPSFSKREYIHDYEKRFIPWSERKGLCTISSNKHYLMMGIRPPITQLHDYRYAAYRHCAENYGMDLYGNGWDEKNSRGIPDGEKLNTLKHYKACLVIENDASIGYFTEKAIHAVIVGSVPIFCGSRQALSQSGLDLVAYPGDPENIDRSLNIVLGSGFDYQAWLVRRQYWLETHAYKFLYSSFANTIYDCVSSNDGQNTTL